MRKAVWLALFLLGCGGNGDPAKTPAHPVTSAPLEPPHAPACTINISDTELRAKDGAKILDDLAARIRLGPADEALRNPKTVEDVNKILRRDVIYLFPAAAAFARAENTREGRIREATFELVMGETQLVASQVLTTQAAWVSTDIRIARATLATEPPKTDRDRLMAQLLRVVDDGNAIAAALGANAPAHIARGAEIVRTLKVEAPTDPAVAALSAEYHRLRGEWTEFDAAMQLAEAGEGKNRPAVRYLRGMEQVERHHRAPEAAQMMREALKSSPKFVRAQSALLLMAPNPKIALRELQKLKSMNEDHYLVMLLEPTLAADHELDRIQNASGENGGADAPR